MQLSLLTERREEGSALAHGAKQATFHTDRRDHRRTQAGDLRLDTAAAVGEEERLIIHVVGGAEGRVHAAIERVAADDELVDARAAQHGIEIGADECAVGRLVDARAGGFCSELLIQRCESQESWRHHNRDPKRKYDR